MNIDDMSITIAWQVQKARTLIEDLQGYFRRNPTDTALKIIQHDYERIAAKLELVEDVLDAIDTTVNDTHGEEVA